MESLSYREEDRGPHGQHSDTLHTKHQHPTPLIAQHFSNTTTLSQEIDCHLTRLFFSKTLAHQPKVVYTNHSYIGMNAGVFLSVCSLGKRVFVHFEGCFALVVGRCPDTGG